ncbi:GAF domain-containing sensor histidine kinase [Halopelagius inordinatus]|uniref:GAF domain-containing sensor histidine kinase n=1 Tax=Halopelagius inordinatus TaxID=553467 RepID=UPI0015A627BA|nr:GAF domain-containing protein [Halopelagius inordinatus]
MTGEAVPDVDFGAGIELSASDGYPDRRRDCGVVVVTDPARVVETTAPTVCYTDFDPEDVPDPGRFDAFVPRGETAMLETQVRWLLARGPRREPSAAGTESSVSTIDERSRLQRLYEGTTALVAAETTSELFARTLDIADEILDFDNSTICVHEGDRFRVCANVGTLELDHTVPDDTGILGETYWSGESVLVDDVREHPAAAPNDPDHRSVVSIPIGEFGVFQAFSTTVGSFDLTDFHLAELLVSYAAETAARIESEETVRRGRERVEALHGGAVELAAVTDLEELFERAVAVAEDVLAFDICNIGVVDGDDITPVAASSGVAEDGVQKLSLDDGSIAAKTHLTGETHVVTDMAEDEDAEPAKSTYRSGLSVPIGDVAVFQAASSLPDAFDETDAELAELLMAHVAVTADRIRAEDGLREERDRSTALFEQVSDAAVAYEIDGASGTVRVREVNRTFEETFGVEASEAVGRDLTELVVPDGVTDAAELRVVDGESHRSEVRRCGPDGERDFILNVVPFASGGRADEGFALYTDITERKRREAELERQNERLAEFTNIVSHDLRNPLSVARGHLELARETESEESFEAVREALVRMETLIDDLLSLARQGAVVGDPEPVDLGEVACRAWQTVDAPDATLSVPATATVVADGDRLDELLGNLFRNAVEHGATRERESAVTVTVGPLASADGFYVEDDGPGIAPDRRDAVFEPGETTGGDGIGYGLPIVRRIAEAHDWSVTLCESATGGARFEFTGTE